MRRMPAARNLCSWTGFSLEDFVSIIRGSARHILHHGGQIGVVFNPHMARLLADRGWNKSDIKSYFYERVRVPMKRGS